MTREGRRHFGESIGLGIHASETKEENLKAILDVISSVREDLECFTSNKVSLKTRDSQMDSFLKAATLVSTLNNNHPNILKPTNQVIVALSTLNKKESEDLTVLELGAEGFPCTIYVDGNRLTSADLESFEDNIDALLSSPSTGEKIKRLMNVEPNQADDVISKLPVSDFHSYDAMDASRLTVYDIDYKGKLVELDSTLVSQLKTDKSP
ncbi:MULTISPECIES: hypothetical protein [unclassified Acinetobacter]|uniref:hypothetical protein n=1 Tax=unclassified Acinetobacter TaxID=196816 RepID=UPI002448AAB7|nr:MULTISPECIES: hypothetical protein [unclassified Acinetobacter]MDH0030311.1 hypothetical protein [Acinetobacter sp. GD04021]MDH0885879.1 hypothetical protein [Acinetobacter sp. GD03873]MDH1082499.1 hypothetical protein [Acinetobacter sp. GD03983]MDH2189109.1 hypothetical protein [Acinetobacter sp. GD03645]MDH2202297.1 hypothetical protein [Acinetobacter sp. GD03647]